MASTDPQTGYAPVNDIELYYEIHGEGEPLVLLHGGVGASEMFGANLQEFAKSRQVIAVHLQAHGRTADVDRPMGYEAMADDIAALIDTSASRDPTSWATHWGAASLCKRPSATPRWLESSCWSRPLQEWEGWYPEALAGMQMGPEAAESMTQSPLYDLYPHANWRALITKLSDLLRRDYDWSKDVEALKPQTMLVYADADAVRAWRISWSSSGCSGRQERRRAGRYGKTRELARHRAG